MCHWCWLFSADTTVTRASCIDTPHQKSHAEGAGVCLIAAPRDQLREAVFFILSPGQGDKFGFSVVT